MYPTQQPFNASELSTFLETCERRIFEEDYRVNKEEAMQIAAIPRHELLLLFYYADRIRRHYKGNLVSLCSIVNAKSGRCSEDCAFCSQSAHYQTSAPVFPWLGTAEIINTAQQAKQDGAEAFGVVISGKGIHGDNDLKEIGETIRTIKEDVGLDVHASVGILSQEQIEYLKVCGVGMLHHNLETSERFFPQVCTTHSFEERVRTLRTFHECGVKICSGGLFGMGEKWEDRVDLAMLLRELNVDSIPLNFLHPIEGTPMGRRNPMPPMEILHTIALYRFILPEKDLRVCGGRVVNLRDLQSMIFFAGANGMMTGNYLTTAGREPEMDWQMLEDVGVEGKFGC